MLLIFRPLGSQQLYLAINSVAIPLSEGDRACSCLGPRSPVVQKASPVSGEPHVAMDATAQHSFNDHATWLQLDVASSSFATRGAAEFYLKAPKGNELPPGGLWVCAGPQAAAIHPFPSHQLGPGKVLETVVLIYTLAQNSYPQVFHDIHFPQTF